MPFDRDSFLKGVITGMRLPRTPGGQRPVPPVSAGYILTESGMYTLIEKIKEGVPFAIATSETVECDWDLPLDLYATAYRTYRGDETSYAVNEGCVMLIAWSTSRWFVYAIASDTPGAVGTKVIRGSPTVLNTHNQYTLNGRTVYWYQGNDSAFNFDYEDFAPIIPDRQPNFDGRECWIAVFGDRLYSNPMITEGV